MTATIEMIPAAGAWIPAFWRADLAASHECLTSDITAHMMDSRAAPAAQEQPMTSHAETLSSVARLLAEMASTVHTLQIAVGEALESDGEMPLSVYEEAAACGALDLDDEPAWTDDDEREHQETMRSL